MHELSFSRFFIFFLSDVRKSELSEVWITNLEGFGSFGLQKELLKNEIIIKE